MDNNTQSGEYRALGLSALGALLVLTGSFIAYQGYQAKSSQTANVPTAYQYTVKQMATADVSYMDSSFYGNGPSPDNRAYVSDLTKEVTAKFNYELSGSAPTDLTTTYSVKAEVKANYAIKGDSEESSNVWKQEYLLIAPTVVRNSGTGVSLSKSVAIPYADYKKAANQFRTTLALPTSSEAVATLNVRTTGTVDGTPFEDVRVSTIAMPLEEQIFQPTIKFDKEDTKQVVAATAQQGKERTTQLQLFGGAALALAGVVLVGYGMRKRIFKSAHQRELDKIYRLHDGIIVRTSRPIDLTDYQVIPMRSFEDMLNLEEELKKPIIADEISSSLTHFLIASSNVMYLYKLQTEKASSSRSLTPTAAAPPAQPATATAPSKVRTYGLAPALSAKPSNQQIQAPPRRALGSHDKRPIAVKSHDELDDIISEMTKKPSKK